jgi:4-amino-4-deoxy-L-arabinose transferase-like glycosyltransferase
MLLAPFWTLGARGHALVWVSYLACTVFYALTAIGVWRVMRKLGAGDVAGVAAALVLLGVAPFAWTSLSGMEVAFASALLVGMILLLIDQAKTGPPSRRLGACLAAASLSRPEATLIVLGVIGVAVLARLRQRDLRAAAWWTVPLLAPLTWVVANNGSRQLLPEHRRREGYFYLPASTGRTGRARCGPTGKLLRGCSGMPRARLWPRLVTLVWLVGVVRGRGRGASSWLAGALIIGAPLVLVMAVVASSGLWSFQFIANRPSPLMIVGVASRRCDPNGSRSRGHGDRGGDPDHGFPVPAETTLTIVAGCSRQALAMLLPLRWVRVGAVTVVSCSEPRRSRGCKVMHGCSRKAQSFLRRSSRSAST